MVIPLCPIKCCSFPTHVILLKHRYTFLPLTSPNQSLSKLQWHPILPPHAGKPLSSASTHPSNQRNGGHSIPGPSTTWRPMKFMLKKPMTTKLAWNKLRWCSKAKTGRPFRPSSTMGPTPPRMRRCPSKCRMPLQPLWSPKTISGTSEMSSFSDVHQLPDKGIHALNTKITALINQCKFPHDEIREMLKIMVL